MKTAQNILRLLDMLSGIRSYSKEEIMEKLNVSERSFFRYMETLKNFGFVVDYNQGRYIIEKENKTIRDISSLLHFSEEEAYILNEAINNIDTSTKTRENLVSKLAALYDNDRIAIRFVTKEQSSKIKPLLEAIRNKNKVLIKEYRSSGSGKIYDREVEPFDFTPNYISIWAYEISSKKNKLFKIDRMKKVEINGEKWEYEKEHKADFLDCFRMGGEKRIGIKFRMSLKAKNLMTEEYPLSEQFITAIADNEYVFDGWVTKFDGVARFILGLPGEIYDIDNNKLNGFLKTKIKKFDFFNQ